MMNEIALTDLLVLEMRTDGLKWLECPLGAVVDEIYAMRRRRLGVVGPIPGMLE